MIWQKPFFFVGNRNHLTKEEKSKYHELNFTNLSKKYWKEQLIFYILCTLSCIGSFLVSENGIKALIKKFSFGEVSAPAYSLVFFGKVIRSFGEDKRSYFFSISVFIFFYFFVVFSHVWFSFYMESKIKNYVKDIICEKFFNAKKNEDEKKVNSLLNYNAGIFSQFIFYIPNQIYYAFIDSILSIYSLLMISKLDLFGIFFICFSVLSVFCFLLQYSFYRSELAFQKYLEDEVKEELFIVKNRDLIIKKNATSSFLKSYKSTLEKVFNVSISRDFIQSLSFVFPSYFLIKLFPVVCLCFGNFNRDSVVSVLNIADFFDNFRKIIERARAYPFCLSSQKKINSFLREKDRDDIRNNLIASDEIREILFSNVSFRYDQSQKQILSNLNIEFRRGNVNRMNLPNGFGKSTIINILMGLLNIQSGEIIINQNYKLGDFNLVNWRGKIAYSEHENLVTQHDLSTGQKQLVDLENSFKEENKEIYIFDEADSNLDSENRNLFLKKIDELSKKKIVILVSHFG